MIWSCSALLVSGCFSFTVLICFTRCFLFVFLILLRLRPCPLFLKGIRIFISSVFSSSCLILLLIVGACRITSSSCLSTSRRHPRRHLAIVLRQPSLAVVSSHLLRLVRPRHLDLDLLGRCPLLLVLPSDLLLILYYGLFGVTALGERASISIGFDSFLKLIHFNICENLFKFYELFLIADQLR